MDAFVPSRFVEQFHLLFLAQLGRRLDRGAYALNGGCNLRFFLRSPRYSEDMGLDTRLVEPHVLRDKVRDILGSRPFNQILQARGIEILRVTEHKQTDTTQRWKLGLRVAQATVALPTKIEFCRRGLDDGVVFDSVDPDLIREYRLAPLMANHYGPSAAFRQKLGALAHRTETQARDVFDLHHLIAMGVGLELRAALDPTLAEKARAKAMAVDFDTFKSQVLSYFTPEDQARYDSAAAWDSLVLEVVAALEAARP